MNKIFIMIQSLVSTALLIVSILGKTCDGQLGGPTAIYGTDIEDTYAEHCSGTPGEAVCEYTLVVSSAWMTTTGFSLTQGDTNRSVLVFNESYPGPTLVMTEGDRMLARIVNTLDETITVHWHGIWQQQTPWMDGVPGASENGIAPRSTFVYDFPVIGEHGTFWYHSHFGLQYADGLMGTLIVLHKPQDRLKFLLSAATTYADGRDLAVMISGISTEDADTVYNKWVTLGAGYPLPNSVNNIVFGGRVRLLTEEEQSNQTAAGLVCDGTDVDDFMHYVVEPCSDGNSFDCGCRIRFINSGSVVPFQVSIQGHAGTVVEADGPFVTSKFEQPTEFLSLMVAQRYAAVYDCIPPDPNENNYWIAAGGLGGSGKYPNNAIRGCAILHYGTDTPVELPQTPYDFTPPPQCDDDWSFGTNNCSSPCLLIDVNSNNETRCLERNPGEYIDMAEDAEKVCNISISVPPTGPGRQFSMVLNQSCTGQVPLQFAPTPYQEPEEGVFSLCRAWQSARTGTPMNVSGLTNNLVIPYDHTVYVTLEPTLGNTRSVHPWHMHGYDISYHGASDDTSELLFSREDVIARDTIPFFFQGTSVYSFVSNHPGSWIAHCHIEGHLANGFALVFTTAKDMIPASPVDNCPDPLASTKGKKGKKDKKKSKGDDKKSKKGKEDKESKESKKSKK